MSKPKKVLTAWTDRDSALWHTCEIAVDLAAGTVPDPRLLVVATFPARLASDERFWAEGPFELLEERAIGDGRYVQNPDAGPRGIL
jgi:hypothetical protein